MATHSSVLPWRIPGTGEPGGLPSVGPHRVGHDWSDLAAAAAHSWEIGLRVKSICPSSPGQVPRCWMGWASCGLRASWGLLNRQVGQEETTCLIVVWRPVPLKDLSSNFWRAFSPKWVVTCKELANFHWQFLGRKRSPFFWNHPVRSSWKSSL